jgi:hypothetical protein
VDGKAETIGIVTRIVTGVGGIVTDVQPAMEIRTVAGVAAGIVDATDAATTAGTAIETVIAPVETGAGTATETGVVARKRSPRTLMSGRRDSQMKCRMRSQRLR